MWRLERTRGFQGLGSEVGVLMFAGGRSLQLTLAPGRGSRLRGKTQDLDPGFLPWSESGVGAAECPALNLILASPLL